MILQLYYEYLHIVCIVSWESAVGVEILKLRDVGGPICQLWGAQDKRPHSARRFHYQSRRAWWMLCMVCVIRCVCVPCDTAVCWCGGLDNVCLWWHLWHTFSHIEHLFELNRSENTYLYSAYWVLYVAVWVGVDLGLRCFWMCVCVHDWPVKVRISTDRVVWRQISPRLRSLFGICWLMRVPCELFCCACLLYLR